MSANVPVRKLITEIKREHAAAMEHASSAVQHVIRCGSLLLALRTTAQVGQWEALLSETGLAKTTAWRYIRVAQDASKKRTKFLLEQGASLVDLYRAYGLVKPCEGGGYRSEAYQKRKALAEIEEQIEFRFEEFQPAIRSLLKSDTVESLAITTIERIEADLEASLLRIRAIKARKNSVDITVEA